MNRFSDKTIVVTGASRGIGEATARHMAGLGAHVVLAARSREHIERIAAEIGASGASATAQTCDVTCYEDVALLMENTVMRFGRLDILVNNAGIIDPIARIDEMDPGAWSAVIDTNVKGGVLRDTCSDTGDAETGKRHNY